MTSTAIISTSINERPEAYALWAKQGQLIVAGDTSSPPELQEYVVEIGGQYLTPQLQETLDPGLSDIIGWKCIQRRNMALVVALVDQYDVIVTVDDDNYPDHDYAERVRKIFRGEHEASRVQSTNLWVNSQDFVFPKTLQRGLPESRRPNHEEYAYHHCDVDIAVVQSQVIGDPDIGAATRFIEHEPTVVDVTTDAVAAPCYGTWAPFNSQATAWTHAMAPLMAVLPGIGRYDDIWAGYIAEAVMRRLEVGVYFGRPTVRQERNEHNIRRDLQAELFGMENTLHLIEALTFVKTIGTNIVDDYVAIAHELYRIVPQRTFRFMLTWAHQVRKLI